MNTHWKASSLAAIGKPNAAQTCPGMVSIQTAMATIIRFSVRLTKPRGTFDDPPTQAHLSSRLSM